MSLNNQTNLKHFITISIYGQEYRRDIRQPPPNLIEYEGELKSLYDDVMCCWWHFSQQDLSTATPMEETYWKQGGLY